MEGQLRIKAMLRAFDLGYREVKSNPNTPGMSPLNRHAFLMDGALDNSSSTDGLKMLMNYALSSVGFAAWSAHSFAEAKGHTNPALVAQESTGLLVVAGLRHVDEQALYRDKGLTAEVGGMLRMRTTHLDWERPGKSVTFSKKVLQRLAATKIQYPSRGCPAQELLPSFYKRYVSVVFNID
ncbi:MAG TPA: hypothetical protein VGN34_33585 [Ktedonobacteraceae bacterium]|jgi:hypothetical protein